MPIPPVADEPAQRLALLGDLRLAGVAGERYPDLPALIEAIDSGAPTPNVVFVAVPGSSTIGARAIADGASVESSTPRGMSDSAGSDTRNVARAVREATQQTLELLQAWLARPELVDVQLVLLTSGAVAVGEAEAPDLATAPVWGLLRSAQSEHPGCFLVLDRDPDAEDASACGGIGWLELLAAGEPQLAVRGDRVYAPRLVALEGAGALLPPAGRSAGILRSSAEARSTISR